MSDLVERQLANLADRLDIGEADRLVDDVLARVAAPPVRSTQRPARRLVLAGALFAAAVIAVVLLIPGPRRTIAHWFGIGSTRIVPPTVTTTTTTATTSTPTATSVASTTTAGTTPSSSTTPTTPTTPVVSFPTALDLGEATSAADAAARTGLPVPLAPSLGTPDGIYVVSPPVSGQIVVVYPPSETLPASPVAGVGALMSAMPGVINDGLFLKTQHAGTKVETFTFRDASGATVNAVWLDGTPHDYVFQDREGEPVFDTLRLATNTLLWQDGDVTYRLEAMVTRDQAVSIAATVGAS